VRTQNMRGLLIAVIMLVCIAAHADMSSTDAAGARDAATPVVIITDSPPDGNRGAFQPLPDDVPSPHKTLLLLGAGAGVIALVFAGLTLTLKALHTDLRRRKRAHRRRFQRGPIEAPRATAT